MKFPKGNWQQNNTIPTAIGMVTKESSEVLVELNKEIPQLFKTTIKTVTVVLIRWLLFITVHQPKRLIGFIWVALIMPTLKMDNCFMKPIFQKNIGKEM